MPSLEVNVDIFFDEAEPDGSMCYACQEVCFLTRWALVLSIDGKRTDSPDVSLCGSCYDVFEEGGK